jgi:hypothetical protein
MTDAAAADPQHDERPLEPGDSPPDPSASTPAPLALWSASEIGIGSLLLGFPAGLGVAARNWYRLGQQRRAYLHLLVGAIVLTVIFLVRLPTGVSLGISVAVSAYLYLQVKADHARLSAEGRPVVRAGGAVALATAIGGWLLLAAPAFLLMTTLSLLGAAAGTPVRGTVTFGTGGSGCEISGTATTFPRDREIRYVARFSRSVRTGEVVRATVRDAASQVVDTNDMPLNTDADCLYGVAPAGALDPGVYVWEYVVGDERIARGELTIGP